MGFQKQKKLEMFQISISSNLYLQTLIQHEHNIKNYDESWVWWHITVIPAPGIQPEAGRSCN
jgi:hypothetical protein